MKKSRQTPPKEKKFETGLFKGLKILKKEEEPAPKKAAPPEPAKQPDSQPQAEPDDSILFLREMTDVRRLAGEAVGKKKETPPQPAPRPAVDPEERKVFLQALEQMDVRFEDELPEDVEPLRPVHTPRMRRLKRGALRIEEQIDLHGLTKDEALAGLKRFLAAAHGRQRLAVLVITGKGNNSPAEPVLQGAVASWLRTEGKAIVAEFSPAPARLGGSGAFVVFLRDPQAPRKTE